MHYVTVRCSLYSKYILYIYQYQISKYLKGHSRESVSVCVSVRVPSFFGPVSVQSGYISVYNIQCGLIIVWTYMVDRCTGNISVYSI